ncbi:hypothetical protein B0F90DRAFT_1813985 [Multifurca ochricompacta]|uniref:Transmembrane protein n=1 Tax=Multifurca ochricompacta TaxID=376703 RepID=A0AAD4MCN3_9AGAM|nr:hypothetical protein B0F90DRAFT_1813985 [Multifurca ochricompacta]
MPGPVIYAAVAISAVAAVIVFKEFIYDPHFRPKISAWMETSRQRRKARPHLHTESSSLSNRKGSPRRGFQSKRDQLRLSPEPSTTPDIQLQSLMANEVESLRSSVQANGSMTGIRLRRILTCTPGSKESIFQPLISLDASDIPDESRDVPISEPNKMFPERFVSSSPHSHSTGFISAAQQDDASRSGVSLLPPCARKSLNSQSYTHIEVLPVPAISPISVPGGPLTPALIVSGGPGNTRSSSPDMDLLGSSEVLSVGQFRTPQGQALSPYSFNRTISPAPSSDLSIELISSLSLSPPGSPFFVAGTHHESAELHGNATAQSPSDAENTPAVLDLLQIVNRDSEVFSLLSQVSSDLGSDEGEYDSASILESDVSSWTSDVVAVGEGRAQHA